ncbi:Os04g0278550 [Oryza sativa Japonica Group]|uniref:Os04g0278550 protein n=1 Tax=Oryza sativa subsp. japonica TaxID=39947 RepID=A0A0P0W823_ORYSJ|nr:hypothetical protein EE612_022774 [Oryza sativa]BAS88362.1 Os04g0278550 [Oryza sativa Japonica Group]
MNDSRKRRSKCTLYRPIQMILPGFQLLPDTIAQPSRILSLTYKTQPAKFGRLTQHVDLSVQILLSLHVGLPGKTSQLHLGFLSVKNLEHYQ